MTSLLLEAGLPTQGVEDQFPAQYKVATVEGSVVGVAGLELHGRAGLLRSLAVRSAFRGTGVGTALVRERTEECARGLGLSQVFLLTTTAPGYFEKHGFLRTARGAVPGEVAQSKEFACVCPTSAICLVWQP
ncbi:MAG: arsenic resistance N-acetyltransferase ArsN2 [Myxococcota bacterium]|nr:arsenic resistance N-acetyltransferase ArsN2 [Myxococcota bacterium]